MGLGGKLPWSIPEDMRHFRAVTMGHAVVMGRRTWEDVGRPLPGRRCVVVSRTAGFSPPGVEVFSCLPSALEAAWSGDPEPCVIGGAAVYRDALPHATRIHLTEVRRRVEADVFFPPFDRSEWRETERRRGESGDVEWVTLERI